MNQFWLIRAGSFVLAFAFAFALDAAFGGGGYGQRLVMLAALWVTLAVSLNLINGITGQFSMGHAGFYAVGAYTAAILTTLNPGLAAQNKLGWLLLMIPTGALVGAIAGFVVGVPSLRLRGDYLAIVTLGFGEIVRIVAQNINIKTPKGDVGGAYGFTLDVKLTAVWVAWMLAIAVIAICRNLLRTAHGLAFLAVREDEVAALAMGVNVTRTKVTAFVIGSAMAGAAGAILALFEGRASPDMFTMDQSFIVVTMVVLGGTGSITGSVLAAMLLFYLPEKTRELSNMPISSVAGLFIGIGVAVSLARAIQQRFHGPVPQRIGLNFGAVGAGVLTMGVIGFLLQQIPAVAAQPSVAGAKLRMVVFAIVLIVLMLLRPQGVLGHHEFSWDWVRRTFFRKPAEVPA
jgi:branched-chain amino acid transport system permease protein